MMMRSDSRVMLALGVMLSAAGLLPAGAEETAPETVVARDAALAQKRTESRFKGEFQVNFVAIAFPDTVTADLPDIMEDQIRISGSYTVTDYYKEFSHGLSWPIFAIYPKIFVAPEPLGYYCRYDGRCNRLGYKERSEGDARADKLRKDALAFCKKLHGVPRCKVEYYIFCVKIDKDVVGTVKQVRKEYPKPTAQEVLDEGAKDCIRDYAPKIMWRDPLWPMSVPQGHYPGSGGTTAHELGHVLGAPDFYHAPEDYDGVEGNPCLSWGYGPTGPAYCRYAYFGFVPPETYPTYDRSGTYTLDPRASLLPADRGGEGEMPVLGCLIQSAHPNYVFQLEYVHGERMPIGSPGREGLLVHVINKTFDSPELGPPDLCYTYRDNDPYLKGIGEHGAYLGEGDVFDAKSDPAAIIPPLIPAGIAIRDISFAGGKCTFKLEVSDERPSSAACKQALLPKIALRDVTEVLPTSVRPVCEVLYRGEPLLTEYGFCYSTSVRPVAAKGNVFPLYHRDRYDGRILGLRPGTKYHIRAYVKNVNGTTYSQEELEVTTPKTVDEVPPLLTDHFAGNGYITCNYFNIDSEQYIDSANPMIALTSLSAYYRTRLGMAPKGQKGGRMDYTRVHTNPAETRPKFRMVEYHQLFNEMKELAKRSGLRERAFVNMRKWTKGAAKEFGLRDLVKDFAPVPTAAELMAQDERIRTWLKDSKPVMLIRENEKVSYTDENGEVKHITHVRYPLDIAIIDGVNAEGKYHVYFPLGEDREIPRRRSGYYAADELYTSVLDACLMYYAPQIGTGGR